MALYHNIAVVLAGGLLIYLSMTKNDGGAVNPVVQFSHLASVAALFGTILWVTFFAGVLLFKNLPRHQFGEVQANIFPWYFGFSFILTTIALGTWIQLEGTAVTPSFLALAVSAVLLALNLLYFGPTVTKVMRSRNKLEKDAEGYNAEASPQLKALRKRFGMLHGLSSLANLGVFLLSIYHLWVLSTALNPSSAASQAKLV